MGIHRLMEFTGESESTFAVENGAHSFQDIRAIDPTFTNEQLVHDIMENHQRITQGRDFVLGRKSNSKLTFGCYLRGDGVELDSGATPTDDALQDLLTLCMGGSATDLAHEMDGSTISGAGATTTVLPVVDGTNFTAGQAIMVEDSGGAGINEISIIESISSNDLTLKIALTNPPSDTKKVWNSYTAYVKPSATATWQFQALGAEAADIWLLLGCVGGFSIADLLQVEPGQLPRLNFDLHVTKWEKDSGTMAEGSYDGGDLLATTEGMEIHYQTHGTTARNLISVSSLEVNPGIIWTPRHARGNADVECVDEIVMTECKPTATFTADPAAAFWTTHTAKTAKHLTIMFGRTAGQSWCIELPNCKIDAAPTRGAHAEQTATNVQLRCFEDDCGADTSDLEKSPIRIHRL